MAQKIITELLDDIDSSPADETITFGLDGTTYEIDLSSKNAAKLRKNLEPFQTHGRKLKAGPARIGRSTPARAGRTVSKANGYDTAGVRAWARGQGMTVPERGRMPASVLEAYTAAHAHVRD